ncbi:amidohydrolase family protein [Paenibacillus eucommiae]|uniref:TIM-barrel fold metal-dependent hydrolase n=1 Tax=Paenibacillus eucommiae TaxID=1355755 RepID=A0ABS4J293_9BACL|nr:amidohydrolase family protein [Paenibacillus eucommiae]MBP1993236.1 putative TIM-barrel fold metal-dependent hydrolase [Paenibacillus eucommiae]
MEALQFFDSSVFVGKSAYKHREQIWKTEAIVTELDRAGIAGALVYHGMSLSHSPQYGNKLLDQELMKSGRLYGCWVVLPEHAGDSMSPGSLLEQLRKHDIRAVKMFPASHQFDLDARTVGPLCSMLEREQIPLLLDAQEAPFSQLSLLLAHHPELKVLLQGLNWSQERRLFPMMDAYSNLCVDFSALQSNRIIETMYARYGADRLFYGSNMPRRSAGAARALIDYADIPWEAKKRIAGGNLAALLNVNPPAARIPDQDTVSLEASKGEPLSIEVYDSHTHLIEEGGATGSGFPMLRADIHEMVELYNKMGIRKMSIAPWVGINGGDSEAGNQVLEQARAHYPQVVEGYVVIDPNYVDDVAAAARTWHLEKGFRGIKPYFYLSHIPYTDPVYAPWWELANEHHLYALIDPAGQSDQVYVDQIEQLAERYPNVAIFMDHAARSFEIAELYAKVAKKHEHVYLQLTYTTVTQGAIEYLVREAGVHKVFFGTDSPMRDPRPQFGWLAYADLSIDDKKAVFGGNMKRLWDRCLI